MTFDAWRFDEIFSLDILGGLALTMVGCHPRSQWVFVLPVEKRALEIVMVPVPFAAEHGNLVEHLPQAEKRGAMPVRQANLLVSVYLGHAVLRWEVLVAAKDRDRN